MSTSSSSEGGFRGGSAPPEGGFRGGSAPPEGGFRGGSAPPEGGFRGGSAPPEGGFRGGSAPPVISDVLVSGFVETVKTKLKCAEEGNFDQFDIEMEIVSQLSNMPQNTSKVYIPTPEEMKKNRYLNV